ncbi:MAG: 2-oxoacid:acceptor oxidoreductase family protein, partial [Desulfovibrio sp.]|nr:2-oxoacid:acceptor oxidoreductase family protein [Desulfovibrio sp.]
MSGMRTMDGNEAAAYISYAFTEVAAIYPITPSSPMAEQVDVWSAKGRLNLFGQPVRLVEMQSEHGAAGAMHGSLEAGALATSYTASQGLLLMIPAMYRMAGQLLPAVLHVSARTVGTHAFSIFGDHSDVMSCRQTGFAMLSTGSVQEVMDLTAVAHLAAIEGRVPFLHFFDGFRTSHELQKVEVMPYDALDRLLDRESLLRFRKNSLNPERPVQRSTVQNPDVFFQAREACNAYYDRLPAIVEGYMARISALTGRSYGLFNYFGSPKAGHVVVAMGSVSGALREYVEYENARGGNLGCLQAALYRPFSVPHFSAALPASVRCLTVLDRTKEPGAVGEPLYTDVCAALCEAKRGVDVLAGRYGLSSKDVTPAQIKAVFDNMKAESPKTHFTVGITDDVTHHSLPVGEALETGDSGIINCKFWGLGADGTVGANKNSIKILGDNTDMHVQAYFEYDTKKSGGITRSHLRFGRQPIRSAYLVYSADFVACHNPTYIGKYDIVSEIKQGGVFLLNCPWNREELEKALPAAVKRLIARKGVR